MCAGEGGRGWGPWWPVSSFKLQWKDNEKMHYSGSRIHPWPHPKGGHVRTTQVIQALKLNSSKSCTTIYIRHSFLYFLKNKLESSSIKHTKKKHSHSLFTRHYIKKHTKRHTLLVNGMAASRTYNTQRKACPRHCNTGQWSTGLTLGMLNEWRHYSAISQFNNPTTIAK